MNKTMAKEINDSLERLDCVPDPPPHYNQVAAASWYFVSSLLLSRNDLCSAYFPLVRLYCTWVHVYKSAAEAIEMHGNETSDEVKTAISIAYAFRQNAKKRILSLSAHLKIKPSDYRDRSDAPWLD